jgi:hypothetical protein
MPCTVLPKQLGKYKHYATIHVFGLVELFAIKRQWLNCALVFNVFMLGFSKYAHLPRGTSSPQLRQREKEEAERKPHTLNFLLVQHHSKSLMTFWTVEKTYI